MIDLADAPRTTAGSAPSGPPDDLACEVCGRQFTAKIALFNHRKTHDLKPGEGPGVEPDIKVRKAPKLSQKELAELQERTAKHIHAAGGMLHAGLVWLKVLRLQNPDGRARIPFTQATVPLPAVETHLPYTIMARSEITARVLVNHAAENETLLRWLVRINGWLEGSETGELIGAHVVAAAASAGVQIPFLGGTLADAIIEDVVDQVEQENRELRHQIAQLQAQLGAVNGIRPAVDERGAGN